METKDATMEARLDKKDAELKAEQKQQRDEMEQLRKEAKAKMDEQRKDMEAKMDEHQATLKAELTVSPPAPAISDEQLATMQARIEGIHVHVTKLLTDEDLFALEDLVADYVDVTVPVADGIITNDMIYSMPTVAVASKLDK
jgi:hypothetical protein